MRPIIEQTIEAWQHLSSSPLSAEDAEEILLHVMGFLSVLSRWSEQDGEAKKPDVAHAK